MGLNMTVLGCSGSYPSPGGACSGYLLRADGTTVWLDAGSGTMANLQHHAALEEVDAVVLSHEHPDHWRDVEAYHVACAYGLERVGVPVFAPAGMKALAYQDTEPHLVWHDVGDGDTVEVGALRFTFSRTDHGPVTLAMRVEGGGRCLAYSADTGPEWSLAALGPGIDAALCEATFVREQEGMAQHLSGRQAGESAREAGVGRLLLTHFWPTNDRQRTAEEASESFGGRVEVVDVNREYAL